MSSFFKIGGGEGGVKPEMTNVIFFLFFLMKASLIHRHRYGTYLIITGGESTEDGSPANVAPILLQGPLRHDQQERQRRDHQGRHADRDNKARGYF